MSVTVDDAFRAALLNQGFSPEVRRVLPRRACSAGWRRRPAVGVPPGRRRGAGRGGVAHGDGGRVRGGADGAGGTKTLRRGDAGHGGPGAGTGGGGEEWKKGDAEALALVGDAVVDLPLIVAIRQRRLFGDFFSLGVVKKKNALSSESKTDWSLEITIRRSSGGPGERTAVPRIKRRTFWFRQRRGAPVGPTSPLQPLSTSAGQSVSSYAHPPLAPTSRAVYVPNRPVDSRARVEPRTIATKHGVSRRPPRDARCRCRAAHESASAGPRDSRDERPGSRVCRARLRGRERRPRARVSPARARAERERSRAEAWRRWWRPRRRRPPRRWATARRTSRSPTWPCARRPFARCTR